VTRCRAAWYAAEAASRADIGGEPREGLTLARLEAIGGTVVGYGDHGGLREVPFRNASRWLNEISK
jgi:hypothetical protein